MLSLKPGVKLRRLNNMAPGGVAELHPAMNLAATVVHEVYLVNGYFTTITSALDGEHSEKSLHYLGKALDFRTRDVLPSLLPRIAEKIKEALGEDFDVVLEEDHLHVEYDPK